MGPEGSWAGCSKGEAERDTSVELGRASLRKRRDWENKDCHPQYSLLHLTGKLSPQGLQVWGGVLRAGLVEKPVSRCQSINH